MELWLTMIVTACVAALLKYLIYLKSESKPAANLPPGPQRVPLISSMFWKHKSLADIEVELRTICPKFGPIVTLPTGSRPAIFICSRFLAHEALMQKGAIFADRPNAVPTSRVGISGYGPTWRILRRNMAVLLHPSRAKDFCLARKWVLEILLNGLRASAASATHAVKVMDHFSYSLSCLSIFMCFGEKVDESEIKAIAAIQRRQRLSPPGRRSNKQNLWPFLTPDQIQDHHEVVIALIRAREQFLLQGVIDDTNSRLITSYVDTLLALEIPDEGDAKRKLSDGELVAACSEFLNAGSDTTSTALQWIMANIVKYPDIQAKLHHEISGLIGDEAQEINEDDISKMPYLKAVVLEGLRRHPPDRFLLPHAVTQEAELGGYTIPTNAVVNFTIAEMGWDSEVWEDPMQFRPERFLSSQEPFDITGSREIKMMPFGAGRRICPALGLAMLHLQYYVSNLVWNFEWAAAEGYEVDLSEKLELSVVMKHPLHACISPRQR